MKILIIGSSGLIGSALTTYLKTQGFEVGRLLRVPQDKEPYWNMETNSFHLKGFTNPDIIINLAGANIADGRWSAQKKQQLIKSRIDTTKLLVKYFKNNPPKLFINGSAIGLYGDRGETLVDEDSEPYDNFLSKLALQWEKSCEPIDSKETRLVKIRTGIVLSKDGGALAEMLPPFKYGLGGKIGSGKQYMSWIDIHDFCRAILFIIEHKTLSGPINMVSQIPVTNKTFSQALSAQLKRPCLFPLPSFIVKLLFGQMGEELLLASTRVKPTKLLDAGFIFEYNRLEDSLAKQLKNE